MQTSYKATGVLAACAAGAAVTSVLGNGSFWGGMLQHGFIAATIGGLADWFAVTAIFRKPFGFISYRTEILVRNRPRIMQALTDFISKDLLSKENIMDTLRKQDFAEMLAAYLTQRGGRERIWKLVREFAECSSKRAELLRMVHPMEAMLKRELDGLDVEGFLRESLEVLKNEVLIERIAASFVPLLRETFTDEAVQQEILTHIRLIKERYEEGAGSRSTVFEMANLTDEKLLDFLNSYAIDWLNTLEHGEGEARDRVIYSIGQMVSSALDNKTLFDNVRRKFHEKVDDLDFAGQAEGLVNSLAEDKFAEVLDALREFMDGWIDRLLNDREFRNTVNSWFLSMIEKGLAEKHMLISQMIEEQLSKLSDEELVEMAESRVADDLQMIRINGSLVGAFVGMGLYLLGQAVERVCG